MSRTICATILFASAGLLPGQTTYAVSPPGFASVTGGAASWGVAAYPNGRSQLADGMFRNKVMILKGISFRLMSPRTNHRNPGRSFRSVKLQMTDTEIQKMTATYSTNVMRTPTVVFQKPVTLPLVTGPHKSIPAPWSLHFPFSTNWTYLGIKDILADFEFSGGQLTNGQAWTSPEPYLWDAAKGSPWAYGWSTDLGNTGSAGCIDSGSIITSGRATLGVVHYNAKDPFNPLAGRLIVEQSGSGFGTSAPAVTVFGFLPLTNGVPFPGVLCNKLHVGTGLPILVTPVLADYTGRLPRHYPATGANGIPAIPAYVGVPIVLQGAWDDTRKGNLLLSSAATSKIPALPKLYDFAAVHGPGRLAGNGSVDSFFNHIRRYTL